MLSSNTHFECGFACFFLKGIVSSGITPAMLNLQIFVSSCRQEDCKCTNIVVVNGRLLSMIRLVVMEKLFLTGTVVLKVVGVDAKTGIDDKSEVFSAIGLFF